MRLRQGGWSANFKNYDNMKKLKVIIYNPDGKTVTDRILDRIRENGGTVFVDPCPSPKTLETITDWISKIFKKN